MPGPVEVWRSTGTPSRSLSQAANRSALGLNFSAEIEARVTLSGCWSKAAANSARSRGFGYTSLGQGPVRILGGMWGRVGGPPHDDWRVGQQQRQHHGFGVSHHLPAQVDHRSFATPAVPGAHLCGDRACASALSQDDAQNACGVFARCFLGCCHHALRVLVGDDDDQGHHHSHRRAAGAFASSDEGGGDGR